MASKRREERRLADIEAQKAKISLPTLGGLPSKSAAKVDRQKRLVNPDALFWADRAVPAPANRKTVMEARREAWKDRFK